ncbi:unnamed protein product [Cylicocyclus nassatus]|uniref:Uncharacterized protein n=1 Tax=Cylicocyclus nassatus TaxID=53992 RepID=A0AA36DI58_CYLNA|nr:unnamed protein product [Cylicocyclus nassatus]
MNFLVFILSLFFFGVIPTTPLQPIDLNLSREISRCFGECQKRMRKTEKKSVKKLDAEKYGCYIQCVDWFMRK